MGDSGGAVNGGRVGWRGSGIRQAGKTVMLDGQQVEAEGAIR